MCYLREVASLLVFLFVTSHSQLGAVEPTPAGHSALEASEPIELPAANATATGREHSRLELADFESLAMSSHPSIAELVAQVRAARCKCLQVGLPPNPTAGYVATEIGNDGQAGQQGVFVGQQFIRGNKLQLNRQILCREIERLQQELAAQQQRVLTEVRTAFYYLFLAQREMELTKELLAVSEEATNTVRDLLEAQEARRTDLLQAEIEKGRTLARMKQAIALRDAAWRRLATVSGQPTWTVQQVTADLEKLHWPYAWEESRARLLAGSPQVASAIAEISREQAKVRRACAEPIPDINAQLAVQYDDATDDTVASVQLGMPIPLWNRNQGGIGEARNQVAAARRRLEITEIKLTQQLTATLQKYESSVARTEAFRTEILERADENLQLVRQAFAAGEASYLDLLTIQRTYFESNLDYLQSLREVNASVQLMAGLMLTNSAE